MYSFTLQLSSYKLNNEMMMTQHTATFYFNGHDLLTNTMKLTSRFELPPNPTILRSFNIGSGFKL